MSDEEWVMREDTPEVVGSADREVAFRKMFGNGRKDEINQQNNSIIYQGMVFRKTIQDNSRGVIFIFYKSCI